MIQVNMQEWTVLTFIRDYAKREHIPPSLRNIKEGCGITSTERLCGILGALEAASLVGWVAHRERTIVAYDVAVGVQP